MICCSRSKGSILFARAKGCQDPRGIFSTRMGRLLDLLQGLGALMCHRMELGTTEFLLELPVIDQREGTLDLEPVLVQFLLCLAQILPQIESLELVVVSVLKEAVEISM
jgi:hypothetical protein